MTIGTLPVFAESNPVIVTFVIVAGLFFLIVLLIIFQFGWLYIQAAVSGGPIPFLRLIAMRLRRVDPQKILEAYITAKKAGLDLSVDNLEIHYLAGGNVGRVVNALMAANKADINLSFDRACAIDLAGRDVVEAVQTCVEPMALIFPDEAIQERPLFAIAKDGVVVGAKLRVVAKTRLERLVGGYGRETLLARMAETFIEIVGALESHENALEDPDMILDAILTENHDADTALEVVSLEFEEIKSLGSVIVDAEGNVRLPPTIPDLSHGR